MANSDKRFIYANDDGGISIVIPADNTDLTLDQIKDNLPMIDSGCLVMISSQMPVGSVNKLEVFVQKNVKDKRINFASSPENLRLGKALNVFLNPDRIVVGVRSQDGNRKIEQLLSPITDRIEWMSVESAEMTKHAQQH